MSESEWKRTWQKEENMKSEKIDWQAEAFRVEEQGKLVPERVLRELEDVPRKCLRSLRKAQREKLSSALVYDKQFGYCVLVTQGQGPVFAYVQHDPTKKKHKKKKCDQCENPNLKGIHTCKKLRPHAERHVHTITITVSGEAGSGKTTLALYIAKALRDAGIKGDIADDSHSDGELTMLAMDNHKRIEALSSPKINLKVHIRTKQDHRL